MRMCRTINTVKYGLLYMVYSSRLSISIILLVCYMVYPPSDVYASMASINEAIIKGIDR